MQPPEEPPVTPPEGFPPIQPKKNHHWYRPRNVIIGTGAVVAGIVVISLAAGGNDTPATHAVKPLVTPPAAVPVTPSATGTIEDWVLGPGYKELLTVQSDVKTVSGDASAQDISAVETDGTKLAQDARLAAGDPPPVDAADYSAAMRYFAQSGDAMAADDFSGASRYMDLGSKLIVKVSAQLTPAGM
jgi:hypothetical protein